MAVLAGVDFLDQPGTVVEQGGLGRSAEGLPEFFQFRLGLGRRHLVGYVDARQAIGAVNSFGFVQIQGKAFVPAAGIGKLARSDQGTTCSAR